MTTYGSSGNSSYACLHISNISILPHITENKLITALNPLLYFKLRSSKYWALFVISLYKLYAINAMPAVKSKTPSMFAIYLERAIASADKLKLIDLNLLSNRQCLILLNCIFRQSCFRIHVYIF